jgi:hypothetical protein
MDSAPWWGTALVAGVFGLAGVGLAQTVTLRLDRARSKREDARRWHNERRVAYAEFLGASVDVYRLILDEMGETPGSPELVAYRRVSVLKWQEVTLIASPPASAAASSLHKCLGRAYRAVKDGQPIARDDFTKDFVRAQKSFVQAVRAELGIEDPS